MYVCTTKTLNLIMFIYDVSISRTTFPTETPFNATLQPHFPLNFGNLCLWCPKTLRNSQKMKFKYDANDAIKKGEFTNFF